MGPKTPKPLENGKEIENYNKYLKIKFLLTFEYLGSTLTYLRIAKQSYGSWLGLGTIVYLKLLKWQAQICLAQFLRASLCRTVGFYHAAGEAPRSSSLVNLVVSQ